MLDVHPPHKPLHGTGEFFLHLFTITIGLLIAVGIEGLVTWHEHRTLAAEARETLTAEIRQNEKQIQEALKASVEQKKKIDTNIASIAAVQLHPQDKAAKDVSLDISYRTITLDFTAWQTAQTTHALDYMSYEEANRFSSIYSAAEMYEKATTQWSEDESVFLGLIRRYLPANRQQLSQEGADAMAQEFGVWQGHLLSIELAARMTDDQQRAFLEGRKPSNHLSETLSN